MIEKASSGLERRAKALFDDSVERVDMRVRSRLTQARYAALEAGSKSNSRPRLGFWAPAFGVSAALVLAIGLWRGHERVILPADGLAALSDNHSGWEDLDVVASKDPLELLQEDIEFYDWVDNSDGPAPAGVG